MLVPKDDKPKVEIIDDLAKLPPSALVTKRGMARIFHVTGRKIEIMVSVGEIPPPIRLAGRSTWIAGRVIQHIERQADSVGLSAQPRNPFNRKAVS